MSTKFLCGDRNIKDEILTIAIPSYKNVKTLKRAIDSILNQKDKNIKYKILVSEDYSENHMEIEALIKSYNNPNIIYYINNPALGMANNWNMCFILSKTKYVALLHDDDYLYENYLNEVKKVINSKLNFKCILFNHDLEHDGIIDNIATSKLKNIYINFKEGKCKKINSMDYFMSSIAYATIPSCGILYKRSDFLEFGGYNENDGYSVDEIFIERFCRNHNVYFYNKKVGAYTYTTDTNLSSKFEIKKKFIIEGKNHREEMSNTFIFAKVLNSILSDGIYYNLMGEWKEYLFPHFIVTNNIKIKKQLFEILRRLYTYISLLFYFSIE